MNKDMKPAHPKEAQVMASILKEMGVTDYEPGVIQQMTEFSYRYLTQVLDDTRAYANYAKKGKPIEMDDIKLSIQMQVDKSFTTPPPRELLLELARQRNANPLPPIKAQCGIRLPPDRYCLSNCNYKLKSAPKKAGRSLGGATRAVKLDGSHKPSISMVTTKTGNSQNVTLVQKPSNAASAAPTQKIVSVNRPLIKVTPGPSASGSPKIQVASMAQNNVKIANIKQEEPETKKRKRNDTDF